MTAPSSRTTDGSELDPAPMKAKPFPLGPDAEAECRALGISMDLSVEGYKQRLRDIRRCAEQGQGPLARMRALLAELAATTTPRRRR